MACTHPRQVVTRIRRSDGIEGVRCQSCGSVVYKGDTLWSCIKRNILWWRV